MFKVSPARILQALLGDPLLSKAALEAHKMTSPVRHGPGRRTIFTLHKGIHGKKYSGDKVRAVAAERGVGNPRHRIPS